MAAARTPLRFGDEFWVEGETNATLTRTAHNASRSVGVAAGDAVVLRVLPAMAGQSMGEPVRLDEMCLLQAVDDDHYLERTRLEYDDAHWGTGRFSLGFVASPSQTATFTRGGTAEGGADVAFDEAVGIAFGGTRLGRTQRTHPASSDRRLLTLRFCDQPTCVVDAYNSHEHLRLRRAPADKHKAHSYHEADPEAEVDDSLERSGKLR